MAPPPRAPIPVPIMGLTGASFGMIGGIMAVTVPQLLASVGAPESRIAEVTAFAMSPGMCAFLLSPVLDLWIRRRTWAVLLALASTLFTGAAFLSLRNIPLFAPLLFAGFASIVLSSAAAGGWLGSLVSDHDRSRLGAWNTVGNIGGGGVAMVIAIPLLRSLPFELGVVVLLGLTLAPLIPFLWLPAPTSDAKLSHERFLALILDVCALLRRPAILRLLIVFLAPAAAYALTNTLGGLGGQFHASERFVGMVGGLGVVAAGVLGSLVVPPLLDRVAPVRLYLLIGVVGAIFTASLLLLPRTPAVFGLAMLGENAFQSAAFATGLSITYRSLGEDNPLAATQVALLLAAANAPIVYMQMIDGRAFGFGGLGGSLRADAGISLLACVALFVALGLWRSGAAEAGPPRSTATG